jgi:hypothetical protein
MNPETDAAPSVDSARVVEEKPNWAGKLCPPLSQATLRPAAPAGGNGVIIGSPVERIGAKEAHAMSCQGPECMWFVPMQEVDQQGRIQKTRNGSCAVTLVPVAVNMLGNQLGEFSSNYRIKAKS